MSLASHSMLVLATAGITLPALAWPMADADRTAVGFGAAVAALNAIAAHALVAWGERRSTKLFLGAVLGGMAGRMALMLAAVLGGVLGLGLPRLPLVFSLLGYFVAFLGLELALQQRAARRAEVTR